MTRLMSFLVLALLLAVFRKEALALLLEVELRWIAWRFRRRTGADLLGEMKASMPASGGVR